MKTLFMFLLVVLALAHSPAVLAQELPAEEIAQEPAASISDADYTPGSLMSFDDSVRLALRQSPYFVKSALQVELQRIDETDALYDMFPDILVTTRYVFVDPQQDAPYDISFQTNPYDPFTAYYSMKASRLATRVAVLGHLRTISEGLRTVAQAYLEIDALNRLAQYQEELVALANHQSAFVNNRVETGSASPIDARIAEQHIELATLELEGLEIKKENSLDRLKGFLGLHSDDSLALDLVDVSEQVLDGFDYQAASMDATIANSLELQINQLKQELQEYNITLAYAKFIPTISGRVGTPDALYDDGRDGWTFSIQASTPVWDWGERFRNLTRQRLVSNQFAAEGDLLRVELEGQWNEMVNQAEVAKAELDLAIAQGELREMERRRAEIRYHSGSIPFPEYLESIKAYFEAQKTVINKELAYDSALLGLRFLSGQLYSRYVDADVL